MTKKRDWLTRVDKAEKRGHFNAQDRSDAGPWHTCAVGEAFIQKVLRPEQYGLAPYVMEATLHKSVGPESATVLGAWTTHGELMKEMQSLGRDFLTVVLAGQFAEARRIVLRVREISKIILGEELDHASEVEERLEIRAFEERKEAKDERVTKEELAIRLAVSAIPAPEEKRELDPQPA